MITKENFSQVLEKLGFSEDWKKNGFEVDFEKEILYFPKEIIGGDSSFSQNENFVVFEAVFRLIEKGYKPEHIELEKKWKLGHGASGGRADILVKDEDGKSLLIIECKTWGKEFEKAWSKTAENGGQLFSYFQQDKDVKFLALYESGFQDGEIIYKYHLIKTVDNQNYLENNPKLKSYKNASKVEDIVDVWKTSYKSEYTQKGIFEKNVSKYIIGKDSYSTDDLETVSHHNIRGKHHEFATILRRYGLTGRKENAFEQLVNLFLCKIIDEIENPDELQFYWKGTSYDTPFDLIERLETLYKKGMDKFLNDEVVHIEESQIDEAFRVFYKNATKDVIKQLFRKQKFFTHGEFQFIKVHNENLFYENFKVLLDVIKLFQDIKLYGEQNQFLGDMFEGFLDQGVKQSEGQFFTPLPIVKFIINSLPKQTKPKAIDYACGSGHFLNEFALTNRDSEIVGVESEYQLSKIAKVSSFMYGNENVEIFYENSLKKSKNLKNGTFNTVLANPPYSVKGFLENLEKEDREEFQLWQEIKNKSVESNNSIECFFIERTQQLLKPKGVAGIIVPSSILSKGTGDNIYVKTREIILKYFHIIAITEFGSGTFGKTGTNTVTLFLEKRDENPTDADNFENMVNAWFDKRFEENEQLTENYLLKEYCDYMKYGFEDYQEFLQNEILLENPTFQEYSDLAEARKVEKDKLFYFGMAFLNRKDIVIVKAPSKNSENKKFLGYEWSSAKGNEGIQYINSGEKSDISDSLKSITTPLYHTENRDDETKINYLIAQNFTDKNVEIPDTLKQYVSKMRLIDMLDFGKSEFDKEILTTPKVADFKTKWDLVKLGDICNILIGGTPSRGEQHYFKGENLWVSISEMKGEIILDTKEKISELGIKKSNVKLIPKDTTLLSFKLSIGKTAIAGKDLYTNEAIAGLIPKDKNELLDKYLFYIFNSRYIPLEKRGSNVFGKSLNSKFLREDVKIPFPPKPIQEKIVSEIEIVDDEVAKAKDTISQAKSKIENLISSVDGEKKEIGKLKKLLKRGKSTKYGNSDIQVIKSGQARGYQKFDFDEKIYAISTFISDERNLEKGDILINSTGVGTAGRITLFNLDGKFVADSHITIFRPKQDELLSKFALYCFVGIGFKTIENMAKGSTGQIELNLNTISNIKIPFPSLSVQKEIVSQIEVFEEEIKQAEKIISDSQNQKSNILDKYLK